MKNEVKKRYATHLKLEEIQAEPRQYQVIIHNDDFTPLEFVVWILERFFYLDRRQAVALALKVHGEGNATCGIYSKDVADSKVAQVVAHARQHQHPLVLTAEAVCN